METVQQVLQACSVQGMVVKLPDEQLDRKLYMETAKKLNLIGGIWKGGKIAGFVFQEDPTELLAEIANGEQRNLKKEFQFFPTPKEVILHMLECVTIESGLKILEPSAGQGAIVKVICEKNPFIERVDCCELMPLNQKILLRDCPQANLIAEDFLAMGRHNHYDVIIANPPFTKNQDIDHIYHMYKCLKTGGEMVTMASTSWERGSQKKQVEFRNWLSELSYVQEPISERAFEESGTKIATNLIYIHKTR